MEGADLAGLAGSSQQQPVVSVHIYLLLRMNVTHAGEIFGNIHFNQEIL